MMKNLNKSDRAASILVTRSDRVVSILSSSRRMFSFVAMSVDMSSVTEPMMASAVSSETPVYAMRLERCPQRPRS